MSEARHRSVGIVTCSRFLEWRMFFIGEPVSTSPEHALGRGIVAPSFRALVRLNIDWQFKLKDRASVDGRRDPNPTAMAFDDRMADEKAHAHPGRFGRE
jgi:hypothetical protein